MNEKTIFCTWDEQMAEMAVDVLRGAGFQARKISDQPLDVYPTMHGPGDIRILVPQEDASGALELLQRRLYEEGILEDYQDDNIIDDESGGTGEGNDTGS